MIWMGASGNQLKCHILSGEKPGNLRSELRKIMVKKKAGLGRFAEIFFWFQYRKKSAPILLRLNMHPNNPARPKASSMQPSKTQNCSETTQVPYADANEPFERKCAFDVGDYGLGYCANSLELG